MAKAKILPLLGIICLFIVHTTVLECEKIHSSRGNLAQIGLVLMSLCAAKALCAIINGTPFLRLKDVRIALVLFVIGFMPLAGCCVYEDGQNHYFYSSNTYVNMQMAAVRYQTQYAYTACQLEHAERFFNITHPIIGMHGDIILAMYVLMSVLMLIFRVHFADSILSHMFAITFIIFNSILISYFMSRNKLISRGDDAHYAVMIGLMAMAILHISIDHPIKTGMHMMLQMMMVSGGYFSVLVLPCRTYSNSTTSKFHSQGSDCNETTGFGLVYHWWYKIPFFASFFSVAEGLDLAQPLASFQQDDIQGILLALLVILLVSELCKKCHVQSCYGITTVTCVTVTGFCYKWWRMYTDDPTGLEAYLPEWLIAERTLKSSALLTLQSCLATFRGWNENLQVWLLLWLLFNIIRANTVFQSNDRKFKIVVAKTLAITWLLAPTGTAIIIHLIFQLIVLEAHEPIPFERRVLCLVTAFYAMVFDNTILYFWMVRGTCYFMTTHHPFAHRVRNLARMPCGSMMWSRVDLAKHYDTMWSRTLDIFIWLPLFSGPFDRFFVAFMIDTLTPSRPVFFPMPGGIVLQWFRLPGHIRRVLRSHWWRNYRYSDFIVTVANTQTQTLRVTMLTTAPVLEHEGQFVVARCVETVEGYIDHFECNGLPETADFDSGRVREVRLAFYDFVNELVLMENRINMMRWGFAILVSLIVLTIKKILVTLISIKYIIGAISFLMYINGANAMTSDFPSWFTNEKDLVNWDFYAYCAVFVVYLALYLRMVLVRSLHNPVPLVVGVISWGLTMYYNISAGMSSALLTFVVGGLTYLFGWGDNPVCATDLITTTFLTMTMQLIATGMSWVCFSPILTILYCYEWSHVWCFIAVYFTLFGAICIADIYGSTWFSPQEVLFKNTEGRVISRQIRHTLLGNLLLSNVIGANGNAFRVVATSLQEQATEHAMTKFMQSYGGSDQDYSAATRELLKRASQLGGMNVFLRHVQAKKGLEDFWFTNKFKNTIPLDSMCIIRTDDLAAGNGVLVKTNFGPSVVCNVHTIISDTWRGKKIDADDTPTFKKITCQLSTGALADLELASYDPMMDVAILCLANYRGPALRFAELQPLKLGRQYLWIGINPPLDDYRNAFCMPISLGAGGISMGVQAQAGDSGSVLVDPLTSKVCAIKWGANKNAVTNKLGDVNYFVDVGSLIHLNIARLFSATGLVDQYDAARKGDYNNFVRIFASDSEDFRKRFADATANKDDAALAALFKEAAEIVSLGKSVQKKVTGDYTAQKIEANIQRVCGMASCEVQEQMRNLEIINSDIGVIKSCMARVNLDVEDEYTRHLKDSLAELQLELEKHMLEQKSKTNPEGVLEVERLKKELDAKYKERSDVRKELKRLEGVPTVDNASVAKQKALLKELNVALMKLVDSIRMAQSTVVGCRMPETIQKWVYPYWFKRKADNMFVTCIDDQTTIVTALNPIMEQEVLNHAKSQGLSNKVFKRMLSNNGVLEEWHVARIAAVPTSIAHWVSKFLSGPDAEKYKSTCPYCAETFECDANHPKGLSCESKCVHNVEGHLSLHLRKCQFNIINVDDKQVLINGNVFEYDPTHSCLSKDGVLCKNHGANHKCVITHQELDQMRKGSTKFKMNQWVRLNPMPNGGSPWYTKNECFLSIFVTMAMDKNQRVAETSVDNSRIDKLEKEIVVMASIIANSNKSVNSVMDEVNKIKSDVHTLKQAQNLEELNKDVKNLRFQVESAIRQPKSVVVETFQPVKKRKVKKVLERSQSVESLDIKPEWRVKTTSVEKAHVVNRSPVPNFEHGNKYAPLTTHWAEMASNRSTPQMGNGSNPGSRAASPARSAFVAVRNSKPNSPNFREHDVVGTDIGEQRNYPFVSVSRRTKDGIIKHDELVHGDCRCAAEVCTPDCADDCLQCGGHFCMWCNEFGHSTYECDYAKRKVCSGCDVELIGWKNDYFSRETKLDWCCNGKRRLDKCVVCGCGHHAMRCPIVKRMNTSLEPSELTLPTNVRENCNLAYGICIPNSKDNARGPRITKNKSAFFLEGGQASYSNRSPPRSGIS